MVVLVRMPLTGPVTRQWQRRYQALARAREVSAWAEGKPAGAWIVVSVPAGTERADVLTMMDAARALIAEADAAVAEQSPAAAQTADTIREWWARQRP
jgi:hypothetical protein